MLKIWHERIDPLPERYKEQVIKKLNKAGGKDGLVRNTFQELDAVVNFVHDHYKVLSSETIQRALFDRYTPAEKDIIFDLLKAVKLSKGTEKTRTRDAIYTRTRSALQKTRRLIEKYTDVVQGQLEAEQEAQRAAQAERERQALETRLQQTRMRWGF